MHVGSYPLVMQRNYPEFMPVNYLLPVVLPSWINVFVNDCFLFIVYLIYICIIKFIIILVTTSLQLSLIYMWAVDQTMDNLVSAMLTTHNSLYLIIIFYIRYPAVFLQSINFKYSFINKADNVFSLLSCIRN